MTTSSRSARTFMSGITLSLAVLLPFSGTTAHAESACVSITETLNITAPTPFGPFTGKADLAINGQPVSALFANTMSGSPQFTKEGLVRASFADQWIFPDGNSLTAVAKVETLPTTDPTQSPFVVSTRFSGGTGRFENAHGKMELQGTLFFLPDGSVATMTTATGTICGLAN